MPVVQTHEAPAQRILRFALDTEIQRRLGEQALAVEAFRTELLFQGLANLFGVVLRQVSGGVARRDSNRLGHRHVVVLPGDEAIIQHAPEHVVAPRRHRFRISIRIVIAGPLQHAGEARRLVQGQRIHAVAEIVSCRRFHPVVAVAQEHQVAVHRQDLLLRKAFLELDRQKRLGDLAVPGFLPPPHQLTSQLHRDRRGAESLAATQGVQNRRAHDALQIDSAVAEELGILGGEDGVLQKLRQMPLFDQKTAFARVGREDAAVMVEELGDQARRVGRVGLEVGYPDGHGHTDSYRGAEQTDRQGKGDETRPTPPAGGNGLGSSARGGRGGIRGRCHAWIIDSGRTTRIQ